MSESIARIKNPNNVVCTMTFTMRLWDWKEVTKGLGQCDTHKAREIVTEIHELVYKLEKTLHPDEDSEEEQ